MLRTLEERFAIYNFLWSQVEKAKDPVGRKALEKNFEAFRRFVRTEDRRQQLLDQRMHDADDFIAATAAEIEESDLLELQVA
jgi:hypothetical protein